MRLAPSMPLCGPAPCAGQAKDAPSSPTSPEPPAPPPPPPTPLWGGKRYIRRMEKLDKVRDWGVRD